jgi:PilZ domain
MNTTGDRRRTERLHTNLRAFWEGVLTRRAGQITDISSTGCFILTRDDVQPSELIRLEVRTPTGRAICLWGEVVYQVEEMGFALSFTGIEPAERTMLELLLDYLRVEREAGGGGDAAPELSTSHVS